MTVTYPSAYTVTKNGAMVLPLADTAPLSAALLNANAAYTLHRPSPQTTVYTVDTALTRQSSFRVPIRPSADGLTYQFSHYIRTGGGTTAISYSVEWRSSGGGGWTSIVSNSASAGASTVVEISHAHAIPATADELRIRYDRGTDAYTPDSVTIYPEGTDNPSARTSSGFWPYDDTLFANGTAPINTEFVNRPLRNARAVLADRSQCLLTFAQEDDTDTSYVRYDCGAANTAAGDWVTYGYGCAAVPFMPQAEQVTVYAIASVSAGSTSNLVRVSAGGSSVVLNATGNVVSATLTASVDSPGTAQARIRFRIQGKSTSGNEMFLHSVLVEWSPSLSPASLLITTPDAPATTSLLSSCIRGVEGLLLTQWCQPALCYEGNTSGLDTRRFSVVVPPACQFGRAALIRSDHVSGSVQSDSTIAATTTSGVPASPASAIVTVSAVTLGAESYYDLDGGNGTPIALWSSADNLLSTPPGSTRDRGLELVETLGPTVEVVEVYLTTGFALHYAQVRAPADWDLI